MVLSNGSVYRCSMTDMRCTIVGSGHTAEVTCWRLVSRGLCHLLALWCIYRGVACVGYWDYTCLTVTSFPKSGAVLRVCMVGNHSVITGYGWLYPLRLGHTQQAAVVHSHCSSRRLSPLSMSAACNTSSLAAPIALFECGVWPTGDGDAVLAAHSPYCGLKIDDVSPNIVHSVSMDATVLSYDLKAAKRIISPWSLMSSSLA